ncbi:hypothetical protein [Paludisphaera borealis]|uniref:Glycosyltransferase RgtA/B/C/D-like domain-containing protein n=1 Tax=Paludisphaera borealis TaxID=1387353 RepID=A0A1U7CTA3_9BACT|nr:hypothetical protein [Paludisphaera borealis]APW62180.1 hypothetical protein BSF38_03712 [Paludisphaera borealis]
MPSKDVARRADTSRDRLSVRYIPVVEPRRRPVASFLDWLSVVVAAVGLALCLRTRSNARFGPLLGLAIPAGRLILNAAYRRRVGAWVAESWRRAEAYARGEGPIPWRSALAFVAIPFFLLDVAHHGVLGTFDTRPVVPTAVSLVRDGDFDLREFEGLNPPLLRKRDGSFCYCFQEVDGRIVSTFQAGMVPFALVTVAPAWLLGADLDSRKNLQYLEKVSAAMVAALALSLFFLTAARLGSASAAAVATLFLATGSGLFTTVGLGLWQHGGVVTWLLAALLVEFASRGEPGWRGSLLQGFALAQMLACRPTAGLLVGLFGLWVIVRSPRRGLIVGIAGAAALVPWVVYYELIYRSHLGPATVNTNVSAELWSFFRLWPTLGILFSPGRGIFVYQPWAVLAVAAALVWPRLRRAPELVAGPKGWAAFCLIAVTLHVVLISAWWDWPGGYSYGSRLATDVVPLLGLLATPAVAVLLKRRAGVGLLAGLVAVGFLVHLPCVANEAHRWNHDKPRNHWSWSRAPFFYRPPS